jgi:hypothetical protein
MKTAEPAAKELKRMKSLNILICTFLISIFGFNSASAGGAFGSLREEAQGLGADVPDAPAVAAPAAPA